MLAWLKGFARFWYHFIIGDDWTLAAGVAVALLLTALLNAQGVAAWWMVPLVAVVAIAVSLRRAGRRT